MLLHTLRQSNLHVLSTDKNLGPAVMTRDQYLRWCLTHLADTNTYSRSVSPLSALRRLLRTRIRRLMASMREEHGHRHDFKDTKIIAHELEYKNLNKFYALAKVHKPTLQLRPIVSNSNTIFEGLSKWLDFKLKPYLLQTRSYLKDSDSLIDDLATLTAEDDDMLVTYDISSLYTNIQSNRAVNVIYNIVRDDPWCDAIISGLRMLLDSNYFTFGDTVWLQKSGTAMGTPVAPTYASLYLAYIEEVLLLPQFNTQLKYYKRYIDDGFLIIRNHSSHPFVVNKFLATFKRETKLSFTQSLDSKAVAFLDLWVIKDKNVYTHKTHQKKLNLYLYIPAASAHPPGVLKGLLFGLVKKYRKQNPRETDFKDFINKLITRLIYRGYNKQLLLNLLRKALDASKVYKEKDNVIFYKVPYDPNGPSNYELKRLLRLDNYTTDLKSIDVDRISICYLKPKSLKNIISPSTLRLDSTPTPASILDTEYRSGGGTPEPPTPLGIHPGPPAHLIRHTPDNPPRPLPPYPAPSG